MSNRLHGLDALRGLAALAVVLYHYTTGFPKETGSPFALPFGVPDGHYGVDLFFIVSGYVIFMTLERTARPYEFVGSRVARLWPAYLACMLLTLAVLKTAAPPWYPRHGLGSIVRNLTMMPLVVNAGPIDRSYWSLAYEIMFYGCAAAAFFLAGARWTELLCALWLGLSLLWRVAGTASVPWKLQIVGALPFAPLFVIGIMIYRIRTRRPMVAAGLVLVAALAMTAFGPMWSTRPIRGPVYTGLIAVFTLLAAWATRERSPLGRLLPLVWLGEISYPLYLIHQEIGYVALGKLTALGWSPSFALTATLAGSILLAFAISKLIEKPGQKVVRALFARFGNRGVRSDAASPPEPPPQGSAALRAFESEGGSP